MSTTTVARTAKVQSVEKREPESPEAAALKAVSKVEDPSSPASERLLAHLGEFVASDSTIASLSANQKEAEDAARGFRAERDSLITFQRRAIRTALEARFTGVQIADAFGVSNQTVSYVKGGLDWHAALVAAGAKSSEVPSKDALGSKLQNLPKGIKRADVIKEAKSTGAYVDPAAKADPGTAPAFTAAQTLTKVQAALDAVKHTARAEGDSATWAKVQETVDALADMTAEQTARAAA